MLEGLRQLVNTFQNRLAQKQKSIEEMGGNFLATVGAGLKQAVQGPKIESPLPLVEQQRLNNLQTRYDLNRQKYGQGWFPGYQPAPQMSLRDKVGTLFGMEPSIYRQNQTKVATPLRDFVGKVSNKLAGLGGNISGLATNIKITPTTTQKVLGRVEGVTATSSSFTPRSIPTLTPTPTLAPTVAPTRVSLPASTPASGEAGFRFPWSQKKEQKQTEFVSPLPSGVTVETFNKPTSTPTPTPTLVPAGQKNIPGFKHISPPTSLTDLTIQAANKYNIPVPVLASLIFSESGYNPTAKRTGKYKNGTPYVDRGIMQINSVAHPQVTDEQAFNPAFAIDYGAKYLSQLRQQLGNDLTLAIAAYRVGAGNARLGGPKGREKVMKVVNGLTPEALTTSGIDPEYYKKLNR